MTRNNQPLHFSPGSSLLSRNKPENRWTEQDRRHGDDESVVWMGRGGGFGIVRNNNQISWYFAPPARPLVARFVP
jgi:hypothetical protein